MSNDGNGVKATTYRSSYVELRYIAIGMKNLNKDKRVQNYFLAEIPAPAVDVAKRFILRRFNNKKP
jgi:hypothetical protein